jgi:PPOX class probable F420-dependent enzyme
MPLTKSELETFLAEPRMAHLATVSRQGSPRVSPIWYVYEGGCFYFTSRLGRVKSDHIQANSHVALSIATDNRPYRAVCAFGTAKLVQKDRDHWLEWISTRYGKREGREWLSEAVKQDGRVVFKLQPDRIMSWDYGRDDAERQERGESMATKTA